MISRLQKINATLLHQIHDAVLLRQPSRPDIRSEVLQRLRFANARERVTHNRLNEIKGTQRYFAVYFNPITEVFATFRLKYGFANNFGRRRKSIFPAQAQPRGAIVLSFAA